MTNKELEQMFTSWAHFQPRVVELLEKWDSGRGVLLISHDDSGEEAARKLAEHLTDAIITYSDESKADWDEKLRFLREDGVQTSLFEKHSEHVCIVVQELDKKQEWMWGQLKGLFEHCRKPCAIVATTRNVKKIPTWLTSHFFKITKTGRPRS